MCRIDERESGLGVIRRGFPSRRVLFVFECEEDLCVGGMYVDMNADDGLDPGVLVYFLGCLCTYLRAWRKP